MYPYELFWGIHLYGVMIALGVLLCILFLRFSAKKIGIDNKFMDFFEMNAYIAIAVGFFASAVWQGVYNYIENPLNGFNLNGGITFIGGLIGGVIAFFIGWFVYGMKRYKGKLIEGLMIAPACIALAHGFGRIGCFFAGCCYGKPTDSWLGVVFPKGSPSYSVFGEGVAVYPTQLFEAIFLFILFGIMAYLLLKKKFRYNFCIYLVGYGIWRFFIEFLRADDRGEFVGSLSPSQFWSIVMVVLAIPVYIMTKKSFEKKDILEKSKEITNAEKA